MFVFGLVVFFSTKSLYLHLLMFVLIVVLSFTLITLIINFSQSTFKT